MLTYPTETTLFQTKFNGKEPKADNDDYWLHDGYDNYYHVVDGTVRSQVADQESRHEKTREKTAGKFSSAWIEHGKAPKDGTYEYMVLIQPSAAELDELQKPLLTKYCNVIRWLMWYMIRKQESQGMLPSKRISL